MIILTIAEYYLLAGCAFGVAFFFSGLPNHRPGSPRRVLYRAADVDAGGHRLLALSGLEMADQSKPQSKCQVNRRLTRLMRTETPPHRR